VREGAREVFVTLLATIAIGLGWAAIEAGQANADLARMERPTPGPDRTRVPFALADGAGAGIESGGETRYDRELAFAR